MPANAAERKLLHRMLILGLALTACAVALDLFGLLAPLEGYLFDQRVKRCQFTVPPPTDRLVHMDVDSRTLETMGAWPFHRAVFGDIVRELRLAGAKVVAWDVIFADVKDPAPVPDDDRKRIVDPDALLAKALKDAGNDVLPVDFNLERPRGTASHYKAVLSEIDSNLELTLDDLNQRLVRNHSTPATEDEFSFAMRETAIHELGQLFKDNPKLTFEQATEKLLPHLEEQMLSGSVQSRRLKREYDKYLASRGARHLFSYVPDGAPPLLEPADEQLPLPLFSQSMMGCGFVEEGFGEATVIRSLPLYADFNGQLVPQFGFAASLAYLGVKPEDVKITPQNITLPGVRPGGGDIVIPVHDESVGGSGGRGTFFDVPLIGTRDWRMMYDYPNHLDIKQHHSLSVVTALRAMRLAVRRNNEQVESAVHDLFDEGSKELQEYEARPHDMFAPAAMVDEIKPLIEICQLVVESGDGLKPEEFAKLPQKDQDQYRVAKTLIKVLPRIPQQNALFAKLIKGREDELRDLVGGCLVFIGETVAGSDLRTTSLHTRCPGVVVHGAIFNAIMTGYFWRRLPYWMTLLSIIWIGAASTVTASYLRPVGAFLFTMAIGIGFAVFNAVVVFGHWRSVLGMAGPLTAVFLVWTVIPIVRFLTESAMRWRIQRRFSTYVDPALVNYLTEHPEKMRLAGELKEITVVFTDLGGFTALTEKMRERAVEILSEYMALVIPVIRSHRGYVSKFVGDGLMFFYGAPLENPHQASDAVDTAMEMLKAVDGFAAALAKRGLDRLSLRIGVNTATMVVGDTGIDTAADYTPLGDGMNLGSRLEGANKMFGTRILISARTVYQLNGRYLVRKIANLIVKGKTEAVMAYEPLCRAEDATDDQKRLVEMSDAMIDAYIAAEFEMCVELSRKIEKEFGKNKVTACYRERSLGCLEAPPQMFNGTIQLSEK